MGSEKRGQVMIDARDLHLAFQCLDGQLADQFGNCRFTGYSQRLGLCGGQRPVYQPLNSAQVRRFDEMRHDPASAGLSDLGGSDVACQQGERSLASHIELTLQPWMNAAKQRPQPRQASGLLLGQIASAPHLQADRRHRCVVWQDRAQVAGADQLGNGAGIARIGFALSAGETLPGTIDCDTRRMDEPEALCQQGCFEEMSEGTNDIKTDDGFTAERTQIDDERCNLIRAVVHRPVKYDLPRLIDGASPVHRLGNVNSHTNAHDIPLSLCLGRSPRLACIALHSHQRQRVISGRTRAVMRVAQPPEPSKAASMTTMPASPAPRQLLIRSGALKRGKAQNVLSETQTAIVPLVPYLDTLRWVFIVVALGGIAVTIYVRIDDWKRSQR